MWGDTSESSGRSERQSHVLSCGGEAMRHPSRHVQQIGGSTAPESAEFSRIEVENMNMGGKDS